MKMIISILILSILSTSLAFRFGTLYNNAGEYIGRDPYLQSQKYSWEHPFASPSNFIYRQKYYGKSPEADAAIIKYSNTQNSDGDYNYEYITGNNIHAKQTGFNNGGENVVRGSYSYVGPDGVTYTTNYIADRNGYRAYGAHLPTQPEELISTPARRTYYVSDRDYYESTVRPSYVTVTPKPYHQISSGNYVNIPAIVTTRRPANSVVIVPTPKSYLTPPYNKVISSTIPEIDDGVIYSTTPRPYYSSTVRPFYSTTVRPFYSTTGKIY